MPVQLSAQRGLQHLPSQTGQQPTRPGQLDALGPGRGHNCSATAAKSADCCRCSSCTPMMFVVMRDLLQPGPEAVEVTPRHTQNS